MRRPRASPEQPALVGTTHSSLGAWLQKPREGYSASLEPGKLYRALADEDAAQHGLVRVVDESGEDYLYPADRFARVELPPATVRALWAD